MLQGWFRAQFPSNGIKPRVIELGGSNGFLPSIFTHAEYEVASNWPEVDVQNLHQYESSSVDVIILNQVLEHVPDPWCRVRNPSRVETRRDVRMEYTFPDLYTSVPSRLLALWRR